jgi:hypothetical protein
VTEPIILGHAGEQPLELDLDRLVGSHLGIVANAGGGKSGLIRRLLEQTHGRIQHIVLDIEDEFYSLRERFDYVIAGGDGDAPATVGNAAALARGALEHGFSLICQLNDLGGEGAREFVHAFLSAMLMAPRDLWRPCLIVIDETQRFDADSIRMLTERGRKRGFTAVLASQRLPKIDANIRGDLNNWIMGRVGQSLDRRIMADQLGMTKAGERELAGIQPRHFWAMGPALSADPVLFEVADVSTTMVRPGQAKVPTPPAPEALREILAGLAVKPDSDSGNEARNMQAAMPDDERQRLTARIAELEADFAQARGQTARIASALEAWNDRVNGEVLESWRATLNTFFDANNELFGAMSSAGLRPVGRPNSPGDQTIFDLVGAGTEGSTPEAAKAAPAPRPARPAPPANHSDSFPPRWQRILDGIAWAQRLLKRDAVERNIVAWLAEISPKSSSYANDLGAMRTRGMIDYPGQGLLCLADDGRLLANWPDKAPTKEALLEAIKLRLEPRHRRILDVIWQQGELTRAELAELTGISATSSSFANDLGKLRTLGLIDYPASGIVGLGRVLG